MAGGAAGMLGVVGSAVGGLQLSGDCWATGLWLVINVGIFEPVLQRWRCCCCGCCCAAGCRMGLTLAWGFLEN